MYYVYVVRHPRRDHIPRLLRERHRHIRLLPHRTRHRHRGGHPPGLTHLRRGTACCWTREHYQAVYLPAGVGHTFIALEEDTVMSYLLSDSYIAHNELSLSSLDPELGLPLPQNGEAILSARDQAAPTLAQAHAQGLLPSYTECLRAREPTHH